MINPIKKKLKEGNIPIIKKKLDGGVVAEANNDGSIYLDKKVKTNSPQAKEAISHEKVHILQMARGDLNYDDKNVYWKGKKYPREVMNEGSQQLPWETEAYQKQTNMKKSPLKKISIGLSQDVLGQRAGMMEDELKMKADKHAAIGRATAQIAGKVPDKFGGSGQGSWGDPEKGGGQLNPTNKNKSPLKAKPITAKTSSTLSPIKNMALAANQFSSAASEVAAANPADATEVVENPAGDIAETETQPKEEKKEEVDTKEEGGEGEDEQKEEKKEEKKGGASHVSYSNPSTSFEKGYEKEAAAAKMHGKNKSKSPLKKKKSPIKGTIGDSTDANNVSRVSQEVIEGVNVGETSGKITSTTTETDTEKMKDSSKEFAEKCGTKANPKAKSYVNAAGTTIDCAWAADEDYDRDQDYEIETHVSKDDVYEPDRVKTPGTEGTSEEGDQYNMGYHEAMDAKWSAGVQKRGRKKVDRNVVSAGKKWERKDGNIVNPDTGANFKSKDAYLKYVADAVSGNYGQAIGSTKKTTTQITEGTKETEGDAPNKDTNKNYKKVENEDGTVHYVEIDAAAKMGKNKSKSPIKMNSFGGQKIITQNKKKGAFKLKGWKAQ
jgi:hypothetical protein